MSLADILTRKFNPYHDERGRFASRTGAHSFDKAGAKIEQTVHYMRDHIDADTLAKIDKYEANMRGKPTTAEQFKDKDGNWLPARLKLHQQIVDEFFADAEKYVAKDGEVPNLIMLGGRGGSGKSKFTDGKSPLIDGFSHDKYKVLDPDWVKTKLPGYDGTNAALFHEESGELNDLIFAKAVAKRMNVVQDVTMKSYKSTKESMDYAKSAGYTMDGYFMSLPREKAGIRAAYRAVGAHPRYVPLSIIASNTDNEANFNRYVKAGYFNNWQMYSNDVAMGEKPKFVRGKEKSNG